MANRSNRNGAGEPAADAPDHPDGNQPGDYEVGYRKPPIATQFKKGKSGNPFGRPRKPKLPKYHLADAPSDMFLRNEAYRPITAREDGKEIELPLAQALLRGLEVMALKEKNRLAAQFLLKRIDDGEERHLKLRVDHYIDLRDQKRRGEALIAEHKRRNLPPPDLVPHPDDIVLRPNTGEAFVDGPETREEARAYEWLASLRDFYLLRSTHSEKIGATSRIEFEGKSCCFFMFAAERLNRGLPRRYQWADDVKPISLLLEYKNLSKRESEQRVAAEQAKLDETSPVERFLPPEMLKEAKRIAEKVLKVRKSD